MSNNPYEPPAKPEASQLPTTAQPNVSWDMRFVTTGFFLLLVLGAVLMWLMSLLEIETIPLKPGRVIIQRGEESP